MKGLIQIIPAALREAKDVEEMLEAAAFAAWRHISGDPLRINAVPFRLYRKTLIIAVPDVAWQKQLQKMSSEFLFRLNSVLGQTVVTYIEFRVDIRTVQEERARLAVACVDRAAQERTALACAEDLSEPASAITDQELRRKFLLAAGSCLLANKS
ncbi:MAG: DciA family protein [Pyrinomonadaceae bacterium]